jgi:protein-S-isoprenylcysteine O-methyltransferase Ste14
MATVIAVEVRSRTAEVDLSPTIEPDSQPVAARTDQGDLPVLTASFVYQWRSVITAVVLLMSWGLVLFSAPAGNLSRQQYLITLGYGVLCFAFGVMLRLWATTAIGHRKQQLVVQDGPYHFCRNPLYWGTFFIGMSIAAFLQSLVFAATLMIPVVLYVRGVVPAEERLMFAKFGADYAAFCRTTPRWRPRIRWPVASRPQCGNGFQAVWIVECRRCQCWLVLVIVAHVTCRLRSADWWPHLYYLP